MQITSEGGAPGGQNPPGHASSPRCALVGSGPHVASLTYLFSPCHLLPPEKKSPLLSLSLSLVFLFSNPRISISLLEALSPKLFWGIATWYVTPPLLQLVWL